MLLKNKLSIVLTCCAAALIASIANNADASECQVNGYRPAPPVQQQYTIKWVEKTITKYETKQVAYKKHVVKYKPCGTPYVGWEVAYKTVKVPVQKTIKVPVKVPVKQYNYTPSHSSYRPAYQASSLTW